MPAADEGRLLEIALIENIQREDLNPIEEAAAYRRLMDEFDLTQEEVAQRVGKDRSTVANSLRLLRLPEAVAPTWPGPLSMGHARALRRRSTTRRRLEIAREVIERGLSVRQVEGLVRRLLSTPVQGALRPRASTSTRAPRRTT